jgi:hypothetical protein
VWRENIFNIYVTEYGTALTNILPILFLYLNLLTFLILYLYTFSLYENASLIIFFCRDGIYFDKIFFERNESGRFGALKSDSTHHFFRNACTKSGSLRFSQFSGCWLILCVYIIMSLDFPFVRLSFKCWIAWCSKYLPSLYFNRRLLLEWLI